MSFSSPSFDPLETELRRSRPADRLPDDLHQSIVCSVRAAAATAAPPSAPRSGWVPVFTAAALLVGVMWWMTRPSPSDSPAAPVPLWGGLPDLAGPVLSVALAEPLALEWDHLQMDMRQAVETIVAAVP